MTNQSYTTLEELSELSEISSIDLEEMSDISSFIFDDELSDISFEEYQKYAAFEEINNKIEELSKMKNEIKEEILESNKKQIHDIFRLCMIEMRSIEYNNYHI